MEHLNEMSTITVIVDDIANARDIICEEMSDYPHFFSCIIANDDGVIKIKFNICLQEIYNELDVFTYIPLILDKLNCNKTGIIGYFQSSLEANVLMYKPLYARLVEDAHTKWPIYESDDLYQMCMYIVCKLYKRGYYLHKHLIVKSFKHLIWCEQRQRVNKQKDYQIFSLESLTVGKDRDEVMAYEILPDIKYENEIEHSEDLDYTTTLFVQLKKILRKNVTDRQWQQLLIEYGNKQTTNWSRMTMRRIKATLTKKGITSRNDIGDL